MNNGRYYYNEETKVTQWDRPNEMGAAPIATGTIFLLLVFSADAY